MQCPLTQLAKSVSLCLSHYATSTLVYYLIFFRRLLSAWATKTVATDTEEHNQSGQVIQANGQRLVC